MLKDISKKKCLLKKFHLPRMFSTGLSLFKWFSCVKKRTSPNPKTTGPVEHSGKAKLIRTALILQATTPNQWQAAEQKACDKIKHLLSLMHLEIERISLIL